VIERCKQAETSEDIELCKKINENIEEAKDNYNKSMDINARLIRFLNNTRIGTLQKLSYKTLEKHNINVPESDVVGTHAVTQQKIQKEPHYLDVDITNKEGGRRRRKTEKKLKKNKKSVKSNKNKSKKTTKKYKRSKK
jgi:hypothetical protein